MDMSKAESERRLLEDLRRRPELLAELRKLSKDLDRAVRWARERGYHVTADLLRKLFEADEELSDEELEHVAGGEDDWVTSGGTGGTGTGGTGGG